MVVTPVREYYEPGAGATTGHGMPIANVAEEEKFTLLEFVKFIGASGAVVGVIDAIFGGLSLVGGVSIGLAILAFIINLFVKLRKGDYISPFPTPKG